MDSAAADSVTTFWAARNDGPDPITLTVTYYETHRLTPQHQESVALEGKEVETRNLRDLVGDLATDADGVARGWVLLEADGPVTGDYFFVTPDDAFAVGDRLVDVDTDSPNNELCSNWVIRFLNGGGFSGGTTLTFWLDVDAIPTGESPIAAYTVYDEAGEVIFANNLTAERRSFRIPAAQLISPFGTAFGALEIQFADGAIGHVSGVMDASGLYSVGFSATCRD